jgi:hypothetical protein
MDCTESRTLMAFHGNAILAVWNDVDPDIEDDYNAWYSREHIPERLMVPGLNHGRRYRAEEGSPRYMAIYEAASMDVLTKGAYRVQLDNPSVWTQRLLPRFRFAQRGLCDVAGSVGEGTGGAASVVHLAPSDEPRLRHWITETLLHEMLALPDVAAAHLWTLTPGEPVSPTTSLNRNAAPDWPLEWIVVVETMDLEAAKAVTGAILARDPKAHGAAEVRPYPAYRLLYARDRR